MNKNIIWHGITFKTDFHLYERLVKGITEDTACRNPISYERFSESIKKHIRPNGRIDKEMAETIMLSKTDLVKLYKKHRVKIIKPNRTCDYFTFVCRFHNGYKDFSNICLLEQGRSNTTFETYFKSKETLPEASKKNEIKVIEKTMGYSTKSVSCSKTGRTFKNIDHAYRVNVSECENPCSPTVFRKRINTEETDLTSAIQKVAKTTGGLLSKIIKCSSTGIVFNSIEDAYQKNKEQCENPCSQATFRKRIRMGGTDLTEAIKNDYWQELLKKRYIPNQQKQEQEHLEQEHLEQENKYMEPKDRIDVKISNSIQKITCSKTGREFKSVLHAYKVNKLECDNPCSESAFRDKVISGVTDLTYAIKNWNRDITLTCSRTGIEYKSILDAYKKLSKKHKERCSIGRFRKRIKCQGITDLTKAIQPAMPNDDTGRQRTKLGAVKRISTELGEVKGISTDVYMQKQNIFYQFLKDIKNSFRLFIARYIQRKKQERREKLIKELEKLK